MRLDKYLKVSRIIKRRTVAADACGSEYISVNGKTAKASYDVKIGDVISIAYGNRTANFRVTQILETQSKEKAAEMYEVID